MIIEKTSNSLIVTDSSHSSRYAPDDYDFSVVRTGTDITAINIINSSGNSDIAKSIKDISLLTGLIDTGAAQTLPTSLNDLYIIMGSWLDSSGGASTDITPLVNKMEEVRVEVADRVVARKDTNYVAYWVGEDVLISQLSGEVYGYYKRRNATDAELNTDWTNRASLTYVEYSRL